MGAFVAVWAPDPVAEEAAAHGASLTKAFPRARVVHTGDAHVTLRFLGERDAPMLERLARDLAPVVAACDPPRLSTAARGAFPSLARARVAVLEIDDDDGAWALLERRVGEVLDAHGIGRDHPVYRPHLTLARLSRPADLSPWASAPRAAFPPSNLTHVALAVASPEGDSRYRRLAELAMASPPAR